MTARDVLDWLHANADAQIRTDMLRYGIPNENALGVRMGDMKRYARSIGHDHAMARVLWAAGFYEARTLALLVADPQILTSKEADDWCGEFDSWAICDTACFHLFDRTPFAWDKVDSWAPDPREFVRRAAFALVWALSTHDKTADDGKFLNTLALMRDAAVDDRPLVKKAVDMALRAMGKRNTVLNAKARGFAEELSREPDRNARWIGRHALKELESEKLQERLRP